MHRASELWRRLPLDALQGEAALEAQLAKLRSTWEQLKPATLPFGNSATPCLSTGPAVQVGTIEMSACLAFLPFCAE